MLVNLFDEEEMHDDNDSKLGVCIDKLHSLIELGFQTLIPLTENKFIRRKDGIDYSYSQIPNVSGLLTEQEQEESKKNSIKGIVEPVNHIRTHPEFWIKDNLRLKNWQSKFANVAVAIGRIVLDSRTYYLHSFDIDSLEVYNRVKTFLDKLKDQTIIVKTKKDFGYHLYWLEEVQHKPVITAYCRDDCKFEIKCMFGQTTLPPSVHRKDQLFDYEFWSTANKIKIIDGLYDKLTHDVLKDCLNEHWDDEVNGKRVSSNPMKTELNPASEIITQTANLLTKFYIHGHRNDFCYYFSGYSFNSGISLESAIEIIKQIAHNNHDDEFASRLDVVKNTYYQGNSGGQIAGIRYLASIMSLAKVDEFDLNHCYTLLNYIKDKIWNVQEPDSNTESERLEKLANAKITEEEIKWCLDKLEKQLPYERPTIKRVFYAIVASKTNKPINLSITSPSGSGKSYTVTKVTNMFPEQDVIILSKASPKSLWYEKAKEVIYNKKGEISDFKHITPILQSCKKDIGELTNEIKELKKGKEPDQLVLDLKEYSLQKLQQEVNEIESSKFRLVDIHGKSLVAIDTIGEGFLAEINTLTSHDKWIIDHKAVDDTGLGRKTITTKIRGWASVITVQAVKDEQHVHRDEIDRRYTNNAMNTSQLKVQSVTKLQHDRVSTLPMTYESQTITSEEIKRIKTIFEALQIKVNNISEFWITELNKTQNDSPTSYGFSVILPSLLHELIKAHDRRVWTVNDQFQQFLSVISKINADCRPKIQYSDGRTVIIPFMRDILEALDLANVRIMNLKPDTAEWFEDVFVKCYNDKLKSSQTKSESKSSTDGTEDKESWLENKDFIDFGKKVNKEKYGKSNRQQVSQRLAELVKSGYIEQDEKDWKGDVNRYKLVNSFNTVNSDQITTEKAEIDRTSDETEAENVIIKGIKGILEVNLPLIFGNHVNITSDMLKEYKNSIKQAFSEGFEKEQIKGGTQIDKIEIKLLDHENNPILPEVLIDTYYLDFLFKSPQEAEIIILENDKLYNLSQNDTLKSLKSISVPEKSRLIYNLDLDLDPDSKPELVTLAPPITPKQLNDYIKNTKLTINLLPDEPTSTSTSTQLGISGGDLTQTVQKSRYEGSIPFRFDNNTDLDRYNDNLDLKGETKGDTLVKGDTLSEPQKVAAQDVKGDTSTKGNTLKDDTLAKSNTYHQSQKVTLEKADISQEVKSNTSYGSKGNTLETSQKVTLRKDAQLTLEKVAAINSDLESKSNTSVRALCKKYGITPKTYYKWRDQVNG